MVPLMVVMECFDVLCILLANGSFSFGGICGHFVCELLFKQAYNTSISSGAGSVGWAAGRASGL